MVFKDNVNYLEFQQFSILGMGKEIFIREDIFPDKQAKTRKY
jgi:hypothetical protein